MPASIDKRPSPEELLRRVQASSKASLQTAKEPPNIFIITIYGFRWQEIFCGANKVQLSNPGYVKDTSLLQNLYGGDSREIHRRNLMDVHPGSGGIAAAITGKLSG